MYTNFTSGLKFKKSMLKTVTCHLITNEYFKYYYISAENRNISDLNNKFTLKYQN